MAKLVYALNQTLDGYVDHDASAPDAELFQHFVEDMRSLAGCLYGRRMYETMRYWDDDLADWTEAERAFAQAWRGRPKWVVSSALRTVGPKAELVRGDLSAAVRKLKSEHEGVIEVAGPQLAGALSSLGLVDEYRIYVHPIAIGRGKPYFTASPPPLRLLAHEKIGDQVVRLTYVPA